METTEPLSRRDIASGRKICEPSAPTWPKITDKDDSNIKETIGSVFQKYKECMREVPKHEDAKLEQTNQLMESEVKDKQTFRSMFVVGFNAVVRKLEKDQLRLVLVNRSTHPAVMKKAILSLALQQRCPAIGLSDLLTPISQSWPAIKSVTCLGVLKSDSPNDFDKLIGYVLEINLVPSDSYTLAVDKQNFLDKINKTRLEANMPTGQEGTIPEKRNLKPQRPVVDFTKYYRESQAKGHATFEGQSFISFTEEAQDKTVVFRNGIKVTEELDKEIESYGIKPYTIDKLSEMPEQGEKRKFDKAQKKSNYKSINIKQLLPNVYKKRMEKMQLINKRKKRKH